MQQAVGGEEGDGQSEHRVDDREGIDAAVAAEHFAEEKGADEGRGREDGVGQVGGGKKRGRHPNRSR